MPGFPHTDYPLSSFIFQMGPAQPGVLVYFFKLVDLTLSNIPPTNTTGSSSTTSTTSTSSVSSTSRRSTGLHPHIYSRLWLFHRGWREPGNMIVQRGRIFRLVLFKRRETDQGVGPAWQRQSGAGAGEGILVLFKIIEQYQELALK